MSIPSDEQIIEAVEAFINAQSWLEYKQIFEAFRDRLMRNEADQFFAELVLYYKDNEDLTRVIKARWELLDSSRRQGTDVTFAKFEQISQAVVAFLNAQTWSESKRIIEEYRDMLLTNAAENLLADLLMQHRSDEEVTRIIKESWTLLNRCQREGIEAVYTKRGNPQSGHIITADVLERLRKAGSQEELDALLIEHPELLLLLEHLISETQGSESDSHARELNAAKPDAFAKRVIRSESDSHARELNALLQELQGLTHPNDAPRRIEVCRAALALVDRNTWPVPWAWWQVELANALREDFSESRGASLQEAIACYLNAVTVFTRDHFPKEWAEAQCKLGDAYIYRIGGERADNLEKVIQHYEQALEVFTRAGDSEEQKAVAENNLGEAYRIRIRGERADNLEKAIQHYEQALEVSTRAGDSEGAARAQTSLGNAYTERIRGKRVENQEQAIQYYRQALEVFTRESNPQLWAKIQSNLGNAYSMRYRAFIYGKMIDNLEQAIRCYQQALEVCTRDRFPEEWAMAYHNLGIAYRDRIQGERADNLEQAIRCYQQALEVWVRDRFPEEWAMANYNLGDAYTGRIQGERADNLKQAIRCYQQALEVFTRNAFPAQRLRTLRHLGDLHFDERNWAAAHDAYTESIEVNDVLMMSAYTEAGRRDEVGEKAHLHARSAFCLLQLGQPAAALLRLEQGRTRLLAEALALGDADLAALPDAQQQAMLKARRTIREYEAEMRLPSNTPVRRSDNELSQLLYQSRDNLNSLIKTIRAAHPDFMTTALNISDILGLAPAGGALVASLVTSQGCAWFVLPHGTEAVGDEHVLWMRSHTEDTLSKLFINDWMNAYFAFLKNSEYERSTALESWKTVIETLTGRFWDVLMGPLHERLMELGLAKGARLILMPHAGMGLLPIHAAWGEVDGAKRTFLDDYTVSYTPSAYALHISHHRVQDARRHERVLMTVVNPTADLLYAPIECEYVAKFFDPIARHRLVGNEATQEKVMAEVAGTNFLHFSCHGLYNLQDVMSSGLLLANKNLLTLTKIISPQLDLSAARLVTLSACETGLTDFLQSTDEYIGLPAGFLQAGAPAVVGSLWTVDDFSTALLMEEFYRRHLIEKHGIAEALRGAQRWLRDLPCSEVIVWISKARDAAKALDEASDQSARWQWSSLDAWHEALLEDYRSEEYPFAHPFYWAAFIALGAV